MDIDGTLDTIGSKAVEVKDTLINQGENVKGTYHLYIISLYYYTILDIKSGNQPNSLTIPEVLFSRNPESLIIKQILLFLHLNLNYHSFIVPVTISAGVWNWFAYARGQIDAGLTAYLEDNAVC